MIRPIWNFFIPLSLATLASLGAVAAPTKKAVTEYPPEYSQKYLQDCQKTSVKEGLEEIDANKLCRCTLREFQQKYTLAEFQQLNTAAETDQNASNQLIEVGQLCFEELLYE